MGFWIYNFVIDQRNREKIFKARIRIISDSDSITRDCALESITDTVGDSGGFLLKFEQERSCKTLSTSFRSVVGFFFFLFLEFFRILEILPR